MGEFYFYQNIWKMQIVFCRFVILWHPEMDLTNCISGMRVFFFLPLHVKCKLGMRVDIKTVIMLCL